MTTSPFSFSLTPCFLNNESIRYTTLKDGTLCFLNNESIRYTTLKDGTLFHCRNSGTYDAKRIRSLGSSQVLKDSSLGIAKMSQRELHFKAFALSQDSSYQLGTQLYTSADFEDLENPSTYLFRIDVGGQVKVSVGRKNLKYSVFIEVCGLPPRVNANKLVLNGSVYTSSSSFLMPMKSQSSTSGTRSNASQATFEQSACGTHRLEMEFELDDAPFYLSFSLECHSNAGVDNIEMRSHRKTNFCVPVGFGSGHPAPLGISFCNDGSVNFALFSRNARRVILCLYDALTDKPSLEIDLDPYVNRTGDIWHISMHNVQPYTSYGYRCIGSIPLKKEEIYHKGHIHLDPHAKVLKRYLADQPGSVPLVKYLGNLTEEPSFDWSGEVRPSLRMEELVVYRLNVERFTKDKSSELSSGVAGTFSGIVEKMDHFKRLGVNAILLEPIFSFDEQKGPYFPIHFFSPMALYGPSHDGLTVSNSMKEMVKTMHANKIEVLLEVVFTHTGQTGSLQGIDDAAYYISNEDGNALNCNYPIMQQLILDSLRYWVTEFHIDGFCFMNASSLLRGHHGEYLTRPPLVEAVAFDPLLSKTKVIADSFDPHTLVSREFCFPHWKRWAEINTKFYSEIRNFLRGEGLLSNLATRLCGSADIFLGGRGPAYAFNFIARNFGLPIVDMVSFSSSELSAELSWNCGEEGPTNKTIVLETRLKQIRNALFILYISMGIPVLNMGDECGQSSGGSSSYSHRKSLNWDALNTRFGVQMTEFIAFLSSLRIRRGDFLQRRNFMKAESVVWHGSDQAALKWEDPASRFLAMTLKADIEDSEPNSKPCSYGGDLFVAFNSSNYPETVILPPPGEGMTWSRLVDTALPFPGFFLTDGDPVVEQTPGLLAYEMESHSCALFEAQSPVS
ncbi:isoamylase [Ranunculus cassubicifolius]